MGDKSLFREAADSITKWIEEDARQKRERVLITTGSLLESGRDTVRDFKEGIAALWSTAGTDRKFLHEYNLRSGRFEEAWRENISKKIGYENFGFRMATGWELPKGVPFNGKLDPEKEGKKIDGMTAVFMRGKDGKLEVLDFHDSRYEDLIVPYLVTQLIVPSMAGKAFGALSLVAKGTKAAEIVSATANTAGKAWSAADNASGLYLAGGQISSNFMLKPDAIRRLGRLMDNPQDMKIDKLREEVNTAFQEYSYKGGPLSEQYYVPPVQEKESPLARLNDLARGSLKGIYKVGNPFEKVGPQHFLKDENLTEVRNLIREDVYFQRGYLRLAEKSLSGAKLSEQESTLLSFGTRIFTGIAEGEVTQATLPDMLAVRLRIKKDPQETDSQHLANIKQKTDSYLKIAETDVHKYEEFEKQKAMAQSMAFAMH